MIGPSGSGKTTLMQHFTGLLKPDHGRVVFEGKDIWGKECNLTSLRRKVGLVFQFPEKQLFAETVYEDIAFGPKNLSLDESEIRERVRSAMERVQLEFETFAERSPFSLSEGEKRRAALAGVLVMQPEMLILDEPTAGLDHKGVNAMLDILHDFHSRGKTLLLISHNLDLVGILASRVLVLNEGQMRFDGSIRDLFNDSELLQSLGLERPRLQVIVQKLKQNGWLKTEAIYSVEHLKKELVKHPRFRKSTRQKLPVIDKL